MHELNTISILKPCDKILFHVRRTKFTNTKPITRAIESITRVSMFLQDILNLFA